MKLARFIWKGKRHWGIIDDTTIFSIVGDIYSNFNKAKELCQLYDISLLAPAEPGIMIACGLNYMGSIKELGVEVPKEPSLFFKPSSTIVAPNGDIIYPTISDNLCYEAELCCVIKRKGRNIQEEHALDYVLGYTCGNDLTLMDLVEKDGRLTRAKGFDTSSPLGPYLVTDIDPHCLSIRSRLNGENRQDSNTSLMIFSIEKIISFISAFMTLNPGDVIWTGTPEGGHRPVAVGDIIEVEIQNIGNLRNVVTAPRSK